MLFYQIVKNYTPSRSRSSPKRTHGSFPSRASTPQHQRNPTRESTSISKHSPKTFFLITLTLIFPLSFAILAHSFLTQPILLPQLNQWTFLLVLINFFYLTFLFAFSLLSTAAVVFTVASLYTSKPVSFSSTTSAIPLLLPRLFTTFVRVCALMLAYHTVFSIFLVANDLQINVGSAVFSSVVIKVLFLVVHVYMTALWHLASVVSVLEPVKGFAAMKKSYELLRGKTIVACSMVFIYLALCAVVYGVFGEVVVRGGEDHGVLARIVAGGFLVCVLAVVNLVGFLVQSVFYYVCKSFHRQGIDKSALNDHLGGYLGEYVPLQSSIQMEKFDSSQN
ncbi:unnamed protein product [Eruca vesicaria subsp. sativa]|uniref:Uncharacterized protein n=1 Tax=Eruca vesicaria subsp. sativa TaxID=29727 RepID=A0ABC8JXN9_ERUVS|nr:unnamed protein product [Eruca vesicaria subsp. sativa]